ncbi:amino acid ABC transporter substrate-binding protein [Paenibacillus crassostreae]|uniref:Amino acid ABC transporter substrate-binding protein n=1 Tax=Paenibacillus crassostreae TaxID=1763538 RepID=A0A167G370_9BACL|nr:amino acid ABC transporter substrate-binding protein [Paenibacillus crassostreae]AOZ93804.1 amino acid ABC transporter substrate-binding protein [Paenibacillus crassostreae]OAB77162.1 amino acid ABC transporter substrate-binding protein [Paenibacillus crassostreae]
MKKISIVAILLGMVMMVVAGCSGSNNKDGNTVVIGIDDKFAPMGFRDDNNELVGFDIDYAKATIEKMGKEVSFQPIDWSSKESELNSGRIDLIWNGYTITDERKGKVLFSKPYLENSQVAVVLATSEYSVLNDLADKNLGLQSLSSAADALNANPVKDIIKGVTEYSDNVMALSDLKSGRTDAVIIDEVVANYYMALEEGSFKLLNESLAPEQYGIGVKQGNEELLNDLQAALDELNIDGTASEISVKWFGEDKVLK